jgi:hypothetical protein
MLATQDVYPSSTARLTNDERRERFREKCHFIDMQLMFLARDAAEFAASDAWDEDGSASAIDWMRFNCHMTSNTAGDLIAVGKNLQRMPESDQAVLSGEIGYAHVKAMARTANAVGTKFDEAPLLEKARENSPGKFYYICDHFRHAVDRKGYEAEQAELVEDRKPRSRSPARSRPCSVWRVRRRLTWSTPPYPSPPRRSSGWPATRASRASCSTPNPRSSMWGAPSGWFQSLHDGR